MAKKEKKMKTYSFEVIAWFKETKITTLLYIESTSEKSAKAMAQLKAPKLIRILVRRISIADADL